ncbi:hypothetical protein C8Q77DRAFT_551264 [Trametes polyzona]|nr:hypothetical protein C8Q77DRAFT_551264 [Trametes polyzona]
MAPAPTESEFIDKPDARAGHIILLTIPSLSFSTPTHRIHVQLAFQPSAQEKPFPMSDTSVDSHSIAGTFGQRVPSPASSGGLLPRSSSRLSVDSNQSYVTKDDLRAVKAELHKFATKEDLKAVKAELQKFATKDDLKAVKDDLKAVKDELKKDYANIDAKMRRIMKFLGIPEDESTDEPPHERSSPEVHSEGQSSSRGHSHPAARSSPEARSPPQSQPPLGGHSSQSPSEGHSSSQEHPASQGHSSSTPASVPGPYTVEVQSSSTHFSSTYSQSPLVFAPTQTSSDSESPASSPVVVPNPTIPSASLLSPPSPIDAATPSLHSKRSGSSLRSTLNVRGLFSSRGPSAENLATPAEASHALSPPSTTDTSSSLRHRLSRTSLKVKIPFIGSRKGASSSPRDDDVPPVPPPAQVQGPVAAYPA